ncbi:MAG: hypothetical protein R2864_06030 [Syntrophotaleaceae bacterium]
MTAGTDTADKRAKLEQARQTLEGYGIEAPTAILPRSPSRCCGSINR